MGTLSSTGNNSEGDGESGLLKNCGRVGGREKTEANGEKNGRVKWRQPGDLE